MNIDLDEDAPPPPPEAGPFDTTTKPKKSPKTRARNRSEDAPVLPDDVSASDEATQRLYLRCGSVVALRLGFAVYQFRSFSRFTSVAYCLS